MSGPLRAGAAGGLPPPARAVAGPTSMRIMRDILMEEVAAAPAMRLLRRLAALGDVVPPSHRGAFDPNRRSA